MENIAADDVFVEVNDVNYTSSSNYNPGHLATISTYWYIVTEIINFFLCIANVAANLFLIFIILRFKRLRTRTNYYLMNIAITSTIYHAFAPLVFIILELIPDAYINYEAFCYIFLTEESGCFTMYLFASILALDWYLMNYKEKFIQAHNRLYKYAIAIVYLVAIIRYISITTISCTFKEGRIHHFLYLTYIFSTIIIGIVNILRIRRSDTIESTKTRYALISANVIIVSWIPLFVYNLLFILGFTSHIVMRILYSTTIFPKLVAHGNTIILLYILGRVSKNFKMAYSRAFRRNVRDYEQDDLDNASEDDTVVEHRVHIEPEPVNADATKILIF